MGKALAWEHSSVPVWQRRAKAMLDTPSGWNLAKLGEVAEAFSGVWGSDPGKLPDGHADVRVIRVSDITSDNTIRYDVVPVRVVTAKQARRYALQTNDIVVVKSSGSKTRVISGRSALFDSPNQDVYIPSNFTLALRCDESQFLGMFCWLYLLTKQATKAVHRMTEGSTYPNLKKSEYLTLPVPLPSLSEQRAISHVLHTVQQSREATEKVIAAIRELKQSLMRHLFTYGPVPFDQADRVGLKETEIGSIPAHWDVSKMGDIATTATGGTPSRKNPEYFGPGVPWVKSGELDDSAVYGTEESITAAALSTSNAKLFRRGTLLIAMYGATAGKVGLLGMDAATNQAVCAIFPNAGVATPQYLFFALMYRRNDVLRARYGGAQPNISQTVLRSFRVPLPPMDDQNRIRAVLEVVDNKLAVERKRKAALGSLFGSMLDNLMRGKLRVSSAVIMEKAEVA